MFSRSFTHETITEKTPPTPTPKSSVFPRDVDDDDAFVEGPQLLLLLFRSFIGCVCTSPSYLLPSKRTEKNVESPTKKEGRPQKSAQKNVSTQKKKKTTTLERVAVSVTRGSPHVFRVFFRHSFLLFATRRRQSDGERNVCSLACAFNSGCTKCNREHKKNRLFL